jgi:hypothetical protein
MALTLIQLISYYWDLTFKTEVLWNVIPLVVATIIILMYFERYDKERIGWGSFLSSSLVLLFISLSLFRYIFSINGAGAFNFIEYFGKTIVTAMLLLVGLILLKFNFGHILPKSIAKYLNSTITINLGIYAAILFVYSEFKTSWNDLFALLILAGALSIILNLAKLPLGKIFNFVEEEKKKEQLKDVKESKYQIGELKKDLKDRTKQLKKTKLKEAEEEEKQAKKLEKEIKKK